jgi:hypothetical protein
MIEDMDVDNSTPDSLLNDIFSLDLKTCNVQIYLASTPQNVTVPGYRRVELSEAARADFRSVLAEGFDSHKRSWQKLNIVLLDFAIDTKLEKCQVEYLGLTGYDHIKEQIEPLENYQSIPQFLANEQDFINDLRFYVIVVEAPDGRCFNFYRRYMHASILNHSPFVPLRFHQDIYDRVTEPTLLFDRNIDCINSEHHMFILEKHNFYIIFRFMEELKKNAQQILQVIKKKDFIYNFDHFERDCLADNNKLFKLKNISMKPYLDTLQLEDIKRVVSEYAPHMRFMQYIDEGIHKEQLIYDASTAQSRWDILKLLDDSYLDSAMTKASYAVPGGKRGVRKTSK